MEIRVLSEDSTRAELESALTEVAAEAGRCLARDRLGRPNEVWANLHEFINLLLDWLE